MHWSGFRNAIIRAFANSSVGCNISVHGRCIHGVPNSCTSQLREEQGPMRMSIDYYPPSSRLLAVPSAPSMFGRDLTEQVLADARGGDRQVPVIVEKCIEAVEVLGKHLLRRQSSSI